VAAIDGEGARFAACSHSSVFGDNVPLETMACHLKRRAFHTVPGIERGTAVSKGLGFTTAPYGSPTCDGGEEPFGNVRNICWFAFNEQSSADVRVSSSSLLIL
jgi:hypothetical protein